MTQFFGRCARLTVFDPVTSVRTTVKDLRIQFAITKSLAKDPNTCSIKITNLNADSRKAFGKKPLSCQLEAGHDGEYRHLFAGDLRFAQSVLKSSDWTTETQWGDGDGPFKKARASRSYKRGTAITTVLADLAKSFGFPLPTEISSAPELQAQLVSGAVLAGPARDELTRVLAPYGYSWSIQDGQLQILKDQGVRRPGLEPIAINESTGMIGSPEWSVPSKDGKAPTLKVTVLLYNTLTPGDTVMVTSREINAKFRIDKVDHKGDTHGQDWSTELELKKL